ncbi:MAG TPA: LuxR C-terminal-related transcriptional regulator [Burkholderiales bacterium]|nr:LuxR C-terminal-related transcriptional regulator [Burkholderiales bacterium]
MRTLRAALDLLGAMNESALDKASFARLGVDRLPKLVASEFTTLSICHLATGKREVYGLPAGALSAADRAAFDRHFHEHPLVRYHAYQRGANTQRISDSLPLEQFRRSALYNDYYRRIRIDHTMALPIYVRDGLLVSFVLNRTRRDFTDRERALLDVLRPHLARIYRKASALGGMTAREAEVLRWVAAGKSDAQIGAILRISARTVQKHLQNVYEKLGVENRTAAVNRLP